MARKTSESKASQKTDNTHFVNGKWAGDSVRVSHDASSNRLFIGVRRGPSKNAPASYTGIELHVYHAEELLLRLRELCAAVHAANTLA